MKKYFLLWVLIFAGCSAKPPKLNVAVKLANDNRSVQISGFNKTIIGDIAHDTTSGAWQSLLPVYKMPADTDMKDFQQAQTGKYAVKDSLVIFTPDTAFKKGQAYFLRCFDYQGVKDAWQAFRANKHLGAAKHQDLPFSY